MANSFNHSSLKKRITMMLKEKSNPWARLKYAYVLPLAAISIAAFASNEVSNPLERLSDAKVSDLSAYFISPSIVYDSQKPDKKKVTKKVSSTDSSIYNVPEEMPQYPGGTSALLSFIGANLKYPADAKENKVEGKVFIQFVVNSEGKVQDAKVVKRLSSSCDNEALRVVNMMGRWIPGKQKGKPVNVKYTLPIMFSMGNNETASADDGEKAYQKVDVLPLYPGGQSEMMKYISQNLRYPKDAAAAGMQGKIVVQFIVGKTGAITHACILRGVSESLNKEALRIVNGMPKWTPGKVSGEPVSVSYCMPIVFKLDGGKTAATESEKPNSTDEVVVVGYN
jgi:TonB family protein